MYFTSFLRGVCDIDRDTATTLLLHVGLNCNWWRKVGTITTPQIQAKLNQHDLIWHLERYSDPLPGSAVPFRDETPFISTTSGGVERDRFAKKNFLHPAFLVALDFATDGFQRPGFIFYGYNLTIGRKATPFVEYAEEVRELNIYTPYLRYHDEGEIVAKINIPPNRLQRVEEWDPLQWNVNNLGSPPLLVSQRARPVRWR
jgi:hypothetical protein